MNVMVKKDGKQHQAFKVVVDIDKGVVTYHTAEAGEFEIEIKDRK